MRRSRRTQRWAAALGTVLALAVLSGARSEPPEWRSYPPELYLLGRGVSADPDAQERLQQVKDDALADLVKSVRVKVTSEVRIQRREDEHAFESLVECQSTSSASMEIHGVQFLTSEEGGMLEALAYLARDDAARIHHAQADKLTRSIYAQLDNARRLAHEGKHTDALNTYSSVYPLYGQLEDAQAVILVAGSTVPETDFSRESIAREVDALEDAPLASLDEAARLLVRRLDRSDQVGDQVLVQPFTYAETQFPSPFSRHFLRMIETLLSGRTVEQVRSAQPKSIDHVREVARQSGAKTVLRGAYREVGDIVRVYALVVDIETGKRVSAADVAIPKTLVVEENLDLRPQNFEEAQLDAGTLGEGEVLSGSLRLELWTDRGSESLLFEEEDIYRVYVRANRHCTLRLIYHLADRTGVVMYEDYSIATNMANKVVEIPDQFRVVPPFGAEMIQAVAYTAAPPPLKTRRVTIEGVAYDVVDESLKSAMDGYKGVARVRPNEMATTHLALTTMPQVIGF